MCYNRFMQITLLLHNIRSVYNVGAILRTAEGLGIAKVAFSGYTPRYNDPNLLPHLRNKLNHQIQKSALGAEELVPQELVADPLPWLAAQRQRGVVVIGLENNLTPSELSRRLLLGQPWPTAVPAEVVLVLGEEVHGIPAALRSGLDFFLEIPMQGRKESFNVSVATGIALWGLQNLAC